MTLDLTHPSAVSLPINTRVRNAYAHPDLADAFAIALPPWATTDPEKLARFIFGVPSPAVRSLMRIRDAVMSSFGVKTASQLQSAPASSGERIYIFRIYARHADEIVLGEDDSHLDFRASVLCRSSDGAAARGREVVLTTVVHCHNRLGRFYIALIAPFHRWVVKSSLRRAAAAGWPKAA